MLLGLLIVCIGVTCKAYDIRYDASSAQVKNGRFYHHTTVHYDNTEDLTMNVHFDSNTLTTMKLDSASIMSTIDPWHAYLHPADFLCHPSFIIAPILEREKAKYLCFTSITLLNKETKILTVVQIPARDDHSQRWENRFGFNDWKAVKLDVSFSDSLISWSIGEFTSHLFQLHKEKHYYNLVPYNQLPLNISEPLAVSQSRKEVVYTIDRSSYFNFVL